MISTRIKSYMNREGEESRLAREREPNCKKSGIHPSVEEEDRREGGEAPWRGRGELLRGAMLKLAEGEGDGAERMLREDLESLLEWIEI